MSCSKITAIKSFPCNNVKASFDPPMKYKVEINTEEMKVYLNGDYMGELINFNILTKELEYLTPAGHEVKITFSEG
jgi:hypothetical protein